MKTLSDLYTAELPGFEQFSRPGRKPLGSRAMTDAERKQKQRDKWRQTCEELAKTRDAATATGRAPACDVEPALPLEGFIYETLICHTSICRACPSGGVDRSRFQITLSAGLGPFLGLAHAKQKAVHSWLECWLSA